MSMQRSSLKSQMKYAAAELAPSLWVRWHLMHLPRSAEVELSLLKKIVGPTDTTVDVGAHLGLYTRALAKLSSTVHAFEPSSSTADKLRRTSARNVLVHQIALSDSDGEAELRIPRSGVRLTYGLASLEASAVTGQDFSVGKVRRKRLDSIVRGQVTFVKIDVEGHELNVLCGSSGLIQDCRPVFLIEAENRHRYDATGSLFRFFQALNYEGFFLRERELFNVDTFDPARDQDGSVLLNDGGRANGRYYINNFFFFPAERAERTVQALS
jgi:FkbM family methyltransferase